MTSEYANTRTVTYNPRTIHAHEASVQCFKVPLAQFFFSLSDPLCIYSCFSEKIFILNNVGGFYGLLNIASFGPLPRSWEAGSSTLF